MPEERERVSNTRMEEQGKEARRMAEWQEEFLDVFRQKPVRVTVKVKIPVAEHPKVIRGKGSYENVFQFNFVGKLLGPRGSSLKRLQERTRTKMAVFGSGSVRSRQKEVGWKVSEVVTRHSGGAASHRGPQILPPARSPAPPYLGPCSAGRGTS